MQNNIQRRNVTPKRLFFRVTETPCIKHTSLFIIMIMNIINLDDKMSSELCTVCLLAGYGVSRVAASFGYE